MMFNKILCVMFVVTLNHAIIEARRCPRQCSCNRSWLRGIAKVEVDCSNRGLTQIPIYGVPRDTTSLVLNGNLITEIPKHAFVRYRYMKEIFLYKNFIAKIHPDAFKGLRRLKELALHSNQLQRIENGTFKHLRRLEKLHIFKNLIQEVNQGVFEGLSKLTKLYLQENLLREIPPGTFKELKNLNILTLDRNHIQVLRKGSMDGLVSANRLLLFQNKIHEIEEGAFRDCKRAVTVQLGKNLLSKLTKGMFSGLTHCRELFLDYNRLSEINDTELFKDVVRLDKLILYGNKIKNIKSGVFGLLYRLRLLSIADNKLDIISPGMFSGLTMLHSLYLQQNQIQVIKPMSFRGLTSLVFLYLFNNRIAYIYPKTFYGLFNLGELNLGVNKIEGLAKEAFHGLPRLVNLQLNANFISVIPQGSLSKLRNLHRLVIYYNKITHVEEGAFDDCKRLKEIMWYPPLSLVKSSRILRRLQSNYFRCNCEAKWLKHWMLSRPELVGSIFCDSPKRLKHSNLTTLNDTDFECEKPSIQVEPQRIFSKHGSHASALCSINLIANFTWVKNGSVLFSRSKDLRTTSSILTVYNVKEKDSGEYICLATTQNETLATHFMLNIGENPTIIGPREELIYAKKENENIVLQCRVSGSPPPLFIWFYNGKEIVDGEHDKFLGFDGRSLILTKINAKTDGIYKCEARNELGVDSKIFSLRFVGESKCQSGCKAGYACQAKYTCQCDKNNVNKECAAAYGGKSGGSTSDHTLEQGSGNDDVITDDNEPDDVDDENDDNSDTKKFVTILQSTTTAPLQYTLPKEATKKRENEKIIQNM